MPCSEHVAIDNECAHEPVGRACESLRDLGQPCRGRTGLPSEVRLERCCYLGTLIDRHHLSDGSMMPCRFRGATGDEQEIADWWNQSGCV